MFSFRDENHLSRRSLMKGLLTTAGGLAVANWGALTHSQTIAQEARRSGKRCIMLYMEGVPIQILVAFVAELRVYGLWRREEVFAELWRILENNGSRSRIEFVAEFARRIWLREESGRMAVAEFARRIWLSVIGYFRDWYSLSQRSSRATADRKS